MRDLLYYGAVGGVVVGSCVGLILLCLTFCANQGGVRPRKPANPYPPRPVSKRGAQPLTDPKPFPPNNPGPVPGE